MARADATARSGRSQPDKQVAKSPALYAAPKVVVVKTRSRCVAALETDGIATIQSVYNLRVTTPAVDPLAVVGLLNSRYVAIHIEKTFTAYKLLFPQLNQTTLEDLPLPQQFEMNEPALVAAVASCMRLRAELGAARLPDDAVASATSRGGQPGGGCSRLRDVRNRGLRTG